MQITTTMVVGSLVNLGLFGGLVWYLGKKPMTKSITDRTERTAALLKDAERQMAEMTAKLAEQKQQLGDIKSQVDEILANGQKLSENLAADVLAAAKAEGEQMRARARREVDAEIQQTRQQLRRELAGAAIGHAEQLLAARLDAGSQAQLIRDFAQTIPASHQGNGNGHHGGN